MTPTLLGEYCLGSLQQQVEQDFPDAKGRSFADVFKKTGSNAEMASLQRFVPAYFRTVEQ